MKIYSEFDVEGKSYTFLPESFYDSSTTLPLLTMCAHIAGGKNVIVVGTGCVYTYSIFNSCVFLYVIAMLSLIYHLPVAT